MSPVFFEMQIKRLIARFGEKAFDPEFVKLVWREIKDMSEPSFVRFCDVLIGSRSANKPPLLSEFREARLNEQKLKLDNETKRAADGWCNRPLKDILKPMFGNVESVGDAVEIARLKMRTDGDDNGGAA